MCPLPGWSIPRERSRICPLIPTPPFLLVAHAKGSSSQTQGVTIQGQVGSRTPWDAQGQASE